MNWFTDKISDVVSTVSEAAGKAYDSVKDGVSYVSGNTARKNFERARRIVNNAKDEFHAAIENLEETKTVCASEFAELGKLRLKIQAEEMQQFVSIVKCITNVEYKELKLEVFSEDMELPSVQKIEVSSYQASDLLKDGIQAVSAGTLAGVGALGFATTFGAASTGTAISTLSGAAATNATLAWLGGGSLAAGGMGVAGGAAVLGGIVAVPLVIAFAASATSKSEKALTEARAQEAEYEIAAKEADLMSAKVACVIERTREVFEVTSALANRFDNVLISASRLINGKKNLKVKLTAEADEARANYARKFFLFRWLDKLFRRVPSFTFADPLDFQNFSEEDKSSYLKTVNFGFALYSVLKVKILEENGSVAVESREVIDAGRTMIGDMS